MARYKITLTKEHIKRNFDDGGFTFTLGNVKSKNICILTPTVEFFTYDKTSLGEFDFTPIVSDNVYKRADVFQEIPTDTIKEAYFFKVYMYVDNLENNSQLKMNRIMFVNGFSTEYQATNSLLDNVEISFNNSFYALMYYKNGTYLQVLRPYYDKYTSKQITASKCTVLIPHIINEQKEDSESSIGLEYMNMKDQTIEILR